MLGGIEEFPLLRDTSRSSRPHLLPQRRDLVSLRAHRVRSSPISS